MPSTSDGADFAFGGTEESWRAVVLGHDGRGQPTDGPFDRRSGLGWVAATRTCDYADALSRSHLVTLLVTECTGAVSQTVSKSLRALGRSSRAKGAVDHTRYGSSRASPTDFYTHHLAALSSAIVSIDAQAILSHATYQSQLVVAGRGL